MLTGHQVVEQHQAVILIQVQEATAKQDLLQVLKIVGHQQVQLVHHGLLGRTLTLLGHHQLHRTTMVLRLLNPERRVVLEAEHVMSVSITQVLLNTEQLELTQNHSHHLLVNQDLLQVQKTT